MQLANMFKKGINLGKNEGSGKRMTSPEVPEGILKKCNACKAAIFTEDVKKGYYICPKCGNYFRVHAMRRIEMIADPDTFEAWDEGLTSGNPLHYKGYEEKVKMLQEKTGLDEAVVTGKAKIEGREVALAVCDGRFMMASMGKVVGEKITRAVERATQAKLPVIIFACSGGARMQEGIHSLMQMAKTSAALKRHHDAGQLYISVLTDPTTGGVTASFAMLGDIILAEPNALIGFAGPRVIEQTIGQKLPKGFQRSEFLLEHGFVDKIVERKELRQTLAQLVSMHEAGKMSQFTESSEGRTKRNLEENVGKDNTGLEEHRETPKAKSAWERVQISRLKDRPVGSDYIDALFTDFAELHGDRYYKDDKAIIGGIARFHGMPVTVIAQAKGRNTKENIERNFGMPSPDGYRKALRLMKQAEKFARPIICFVDTPGAFCGLEAEERGQGEAIARNLFEMSGLKVPVLSIVIGEGGSGGALAMATSDEVWMLENSIYSILSPEGFASILWKDSKRAEEAAKVMKLTAAHLYQAGIVEKVFEEPEHLTVENMGGLTGEIDRSIQEFLKKYGALSTEELTEKRYQRFRNM
ncbi:acetyl-CoA carboxylase carboxyltransferase subunit alpha [Bariatricus sp. HCP3S3_E12]|uniref:acetyl-CoA carboxylase carboxyltransferase subunit alpha n=1 Tax=Bariatricus sp. HCP3S3_E12 TaxID=3438906 RepID=UPI003F8B935D